MHKWLFLSGPFALSLSKGSLSLLKSKTMESFDKLRMSGSRFNVEREFL
jgi:hypothetical protein